jgi:hypothetical protein
VARKASQDASNVVFVDVRDNTLDAYSLKSDSAPVTAHIEVRNLDVAEQTIQMGVVEPELSAMLALLPDSARVPPGGSMFTEVRLQSGTHQSGVTLQGVLVAVGERGIARRNLSVHVDLAGPRSDVAVPINDRLDSLTLAATNYFPTPFTYPVSGLVTLLGALLAWQLARPTSPAADVGDIADGPLAEVEEEDGFPRTPTWNWSAALLPLGLLALGALFSVFAAVMKWDALVFPSPWVSLRFGSGLRGWAGLWAIAGPTHQSIRTA